jgi:hypothetical protein
MKLCLTSSSQLGISSVKTPSDPDGHIPLHYLVRIWAIKELVAFGRESVTSGLREMIDLLREGAWGFLGQRVAGGAL